MLQCKRIFIKIDPQNYTQTKKCNEFDLKQLFGLLRFLNNICFAKYDYYDTGLPI